MTKTTYPYQSAGRLMTNNIIKINPKSSIKDVENILLQKSNQFDSINYIYVTDDNNKLLGVVSIKDIFHSDKETKVREIMEENVKKVRSSTDQERVAILALQNKIEEVPVIDKNNTLLGVVTNNSIMQVLHSEGVEDLLLFGGIVSDNPYDDIFNLSILTSLKHRLPWLVLGLLGGMIAAGIINFFDDIISTNLILAAFIPLIVYMSDAVGTQMQAFIIRDLASNATMNFKKYLIRQSLIILSAGAILSLIVYAISIFIYKDPVISLVLGIALFVAIISSLITGLFVPFIFNKMKFDPANVSGPVGTILQDIVSILVYFLIATIIL